MTPELAQVATGLDAVEVQSLILESERLGLLGRRPTRRSTAQRYHPLVREFLEERLLRAVGAAGVRDLHVAVANWAETTDWRTAAHHFAAAGRWDDLRRVLDLHVETIVASGAFVTARDLVRLLPTAADSATAQVVLSRASGADGDYKLAAEYAATAAKLAPTSDVVIGNLVAVAMLEGRYAEATALTDDFARLARSPLMRAVAAATQLVAEASRTGDLRTAVTACEALAEQCHLDGLTHFEGISWLNAALLHRAAGRTDASLSSARRAVDALSMSSAGPELAASRFAEAAALAALGRLTDSRGIYSVVLPTLSGHARNECLVEWAELEGLRRRRRGRRSCPVDG